MKASTSAVKGWRKCRFWEGGLIRIESWSQMRASFDRTPSSRTLFGSDELISRILIDFVDPPFHELILHPE